MVAEAILQAAVGGMTPAVASAHRRRNPTHFGAASTFEGEQPKHKHTSTPIAHHETHSAFRPCMSTNA